MRIRAILALAAGAALVAGGAALGSVAPRAASTAPAPTAPSGAWFCPHGGGPAWRAVLSVTNPGRSPVPIRVTTFAKDGAGAPRRIVVPAETHVRVPVKARSRGAGTELEYFGGWVGASWIVSAGGHESGIDASPCAPDLARTWFMPDGTTVRGQDGWIVVMNPTSSVADFSLQLDTETNTILTKNWSGLVLQPHRSASYHLSTQALGRPTVAAELHVSIGRVAAGSIGASASGGIRTSIGQSGPARDLVLPGGPDSGRSELVIDDAGSGRVTYSGTALRGTAAQALGQFQGESLQPGQARTYDVATDPSSALTVESAGGIAAARRSFGPSGDQASTVGGSPGPAWVVSSGTVSRRGQWRLVLANPGRTQAVVRLYLLSSAGLSAKLSPRVVTIPPERTKLVPASFTLAARAGSVVGVAVHGTFVPLAASYTSGTGYSAAVGVPIPPRWIPRAL